MFLYEGELVEHGPTEEMFEHPKAARTEHYVTGRYSAQYRHPVP